MVFLLYFGGPLPFSVLNNCYFCVSRLLYLISSLTLLFSLNSLHLRGPLPLSALKNCYSCCYRLLYSLFLLYLWGPLPFSPLKNCYSCWYRLLDVSFLLNLLFSLFLLYLLGPLPFSAWENCYSCCCRLLHLLFLYILSKCFVIFVILAIACISGHISLTVSYHISLIPGKRRPAGCRFHHEDLKGKKRRPLPHTLSFRIQ